MLFTTHYKMKTLFTTITLLAMLAFGLAWTAPQTARAAAYLKLGDIKGEATDAKHKDWIAVQSVSAGFTAPGPGGGSGVALGDVVVVKEVDTSSPKILEAIANDTTFPTVDIDFTLDNPTGTESEPYLKYELKEVLVTSYDLSGGGGSTVPTEIVSLSVRGAGNIVQDTFNATGQRVTRDVQSFRIDPATGLADFNFVDPVIRFENNVDLQPFGTPNFLDDDDDGDGLADEVTFSALSTSGADGFSARRRGGAVVEDLTLSLELTRTDPNIVVVEGSAKKGNVETTWKVEEGQKSIPGGGTRFQLEHFADFSSLGSTVYEYTIENGGSVIATGLVSPFDSISLQSSDPSDTYLAEMRLNLEEIEWTYTQMDNVVVPGFGEVVLDPTLATTVSLRAITTGTFNSGDWDEISFGFGNFDQVVLSGASAIPEPASVALLMLGTLCLATAVRCRP